MNNVEPNVPPQLTNIIEDFQFAEGREKLELLLEYSEKLPPLPEWLLTQRDRMEPVPECMTPVFLHTELQDGGMVFYFDVPPEAPTVRGYAELLREGLTGSTPQQILALPVDIYLKLGLEQVLTHQRLNGIAALLAHIKYQALQKINAR
jgi:cysteine desulfuration protein SufE